ncbi:MAG: hypothetical protein AAGJ32_00215 [Pseudomonadota bacterium]
MKAPIVYDRRVGAAVIGAVAVQFVAVFMWIGAAAERLDALEKTRLELTNDHVRLAKLETQLELIHRQLDRIEARLGAEP